MFGAILFSSISYAQENTLDDRDPVSMIKASIIFQFAYQSEWPDANRSSSSDFWIGVYNNETVYAYLIEKYATQPIGSQILKIKKIENLNDCSSVQILFVDKSKQVDMKDINQIIKNENVMMISDVEDAFSKGATVQFLVEDSKTKYAINEDRAKKNGILIGNMLKEWAVKR